MRDIEAIDSGLRSWRLFAVRLGKRGGRYRRSTRRMRS
jgi:hypothetical protein